jgi:hypothetical protein
MLKTTCSQCNETIEYNETDDLYAVIAGHLAACKGAGQKPPRPRLSEVVPEEAIKGNLVTIDDILDKLVLVKGLTWRDSSFKEDQEYLSLIIDLDGEEKTLNTGATQVLGAFKALKAEDLPVYALFEKVARPDGKRVYRVS